MEKGISEIKLAKLCGVNPETLRHWRINFLPIGVNPEQGRSQNYGPDEAFRVLVVAEIMKFGGSRRESADLTGHLAFAVEMARKDGYEPIIPRYLFRKTSWVAGGDAQRVTVWDFSSKELPTMGVRDIGLMVIDLWAIRARAEKIFS